MRDENDRAAFAGLEGGADASRDRIEAKARELLEYKVFVGAHSLDRRALKARFVVS